jgi:predicted acylesterase/phospholipase RssA
MSNPETPLLGEWLGEEPYELALPAGWLRVFAHVGTLIALEKHGVEPASGRGASAGAEALGFYAAVQLWPAIYQLWLYPTWKRRRSSHCKCQITLDYRFGLPP